MSAIILARLIWFLNVDAIAKQEITKCVFYNIQKSQKVNLHRRYRYCKDIILKIDASIRGDTYPHVAPHFNSKSQYGI